MAEKIRLGYVGANVHSNWASQSHYPALAASPLGTGATLPPLATSPSGMAAVTSPSPLGGDTVFGSGFESLFGE